MLPKLYGEIKGIVHLFYDDIMESYLICVEILTKPEIQWHYLCLVANLSENTLLKTAFGAVVCISGSFVISSVNNTAPD